MPITITGNQIISNVDLNIRPNGVQSPLSYLTNGARFSNRTPAFTAIGTVGAWRYRDNFGQGANPEINSVVGWTWTQQGAGSFGMNSNGRYFAPVTGRYYFYFSTYAYNDNNATSSYMHLHFTKNSGYGWNNGRQPHNIYMHATPINHEDGIVVSCNMQLNQGEYCVVRPYWNTGNASRIFASYTMFAGALIG
jgi:hypothetical protein